jgi:hypothetical protein
MDRHGISPSIDRPIVAMCAGKDCRKRDEFAKVHHELSERCDIVDLRCVGICSGPVVVVRPTSDQPLVFSKLRKKQQRRELVAVAVSNGKPSAVLRSRSVSGSKRQATLKQVRRRLSAA